MSHMLAHYYGLCTIWRRYVAAAFSTCPTNLYEYCSCTRFYLQKV